MRRSPPCFGSPRRKAFMGILPFVGRKAEISEDQQPLKYVFSLLEWNDSKSAAHDQSS
jgi:hypothetical protein